MGTWLCSKDESRSWIVCAAHWKSRGATKCDPSCREYRSGMSCVQGGRMGIPTEEFLGAAWASSLLELELVMLSLCYRRFLL